MILNRENVANSVVMVQPSLISYSFHAGPEPALLDVAAIAADKILLLDSFFTVVIFHGSTIAQWRKAGYHNEPEHQVFFENAIANLRIVILFSFVLRFLLENYSIQLIGSIYHQESVRLIIGEIVSVFLLISVFWTNYCRLWALLDHIGLRLNSVRCLGLSLYFQV